MRYPKEKRRSPRNTSLMLDILHIVVGMFVVLCAVFVFLNPERNRFLLPAVFVLAAILNGVNGFIRLNDSGRGKKKKIGAILQCVAGGLLAAVAAVSAVSIWR